MLIADRLCAKLYQIAIRDEKLMTRPQKAILSFLSVLACFMVLLAVWVWQGKWQQPLGPALQIPTVTPFIDACNVDT